jgi:hypothetical protein
VDAFLIHRAPISFYGDIPDSYYHLGPKGANRPIMPPPVQGWCSRREEEKEGIGFADSRLHDAPVMSQGQYRGQCLEICTASFDY